LPLTPAQQATAPSFCYFQSNRYYDHDLADHGLCARHADRICSASAQLQTLFVASKIPNYLWRLFAEGTFAHAFGLVLADYKQRGDQVELRAFIDKTLTRS